MQQPRQPLPPCMQQPVQSLAQAAPLSGGLRLAQMTPSAIREVHNHAVALPRAAAADGLIYLHFGESDAGAPPFVREAGREALRGDWVFYSDNRGHPQLLSALVRHYQQQLGVRLEAERFVVTCGGVQAILLAMLGCLSAGDDVLLLTPAWPNLAQAIGLAGGHVHMLPLAHDAASQCFRLEAQALERRLEALPRARMVVVNTPANPTGFVMREEEKTALLELCRRRGLLLLADEMYARIQFLEPAPPSFLQLARPDDALIAINGFSKAYAMTGWRLGYLIAPAALAVPLSQMQEFVTSCAPAMAQAAAIQALEHGEDYVRESLRTYRAQRDLVLARLGRLAGTRLVRPDGAFYLFFQAPGSEDSVACCKQLAAETGVVLAPGAAFGAGGEGWLRLCFAKSPPLLEEALTRLEGFWH